MPAATHPPPSACPAAARSGSGSLPRRHRRLPRRRPRPPRARPGPRPPPTWPVRCLRDGARTANQRRASSAAANQLRACWQVRGGSGESAAVERAERSIQARAIERRELERGDIPRDTPGDTHGDIRGGFYGGAVAPPIPPRGSRGRAGVARGHERPPRRGRNDGARAERSCGPAFPGP